MIKYIIETVYNDGEKEYKAFYANDIEQADEKFIEYYNAIEGDYEIYNINLLTPYEFLEEMSYKFNFEIINYKHNSLEAMIKTDDILEITKYNVYENKWY